MNINNTQLEESLQPMTRISCSAAQYDCTDTSLISRHNNSSLLSFFLTTLVVKDPQFSFTTHSGSGLATRNWNRTQSPSHCSNQVVSRSPSSVELFQLSGDTPSTTRTHHPVEDTVSSPSWSQAPSSTLFTKPTNFPSLLRDQDACKFVQQ